MDLAQVKTAPSINEALAAARRQSRIHAGRVRLERLETAESRLASRAFNEQLQRLVVEDTATLTRLRSEHQATLTGAMQRQIDDWKQSTPSAVASMHLTWDDIRTTTNVLISDPAGPSYVSRSTASDIDFSPGVEVSKTNRAPWDNWAHLSFDSSRADALEHGHSIGVEELSFSFPWQNTTGSYAVINVTSHLSLVGGVVIHRSGNVLGSSSASVDLDARLRLLQTWTPSISEPVSQAAQSVRILSGSLEGGGFWDLGDIAQSPLQTTTPLSYSQLVVPIDGLVVIEVVFAISYAHSDENSYVTVQCGGDLGLVAVPQVQIQYLTPPPPNG